MIRRRILTAAGLALLLLAATSVWSQSRRVQVTPTVPPAVVTGTSLAVVVSPNNHDVWAYSKFTGQWYLQSLPVPSRQPIQPLAGDVVAMFQAGRQVYAFSAPQGIWQTLDLEEGAQLRPQIMEDWCLVVAGNSVHAFSAVTGKWVTLDLRGP